MSNIFYHFIQRVKERYNIDLTLEDLKKIAEQIYSGRAKLTKITSHSFQYKVRLGKKILVIIVDLEHSKFITALPDNKYTNKSTFSGKQYHYIDALYVKRLLNKFFDKDESGTYFCEKCGSTSIRVELDKNRFKCMNCFKLTKISDLEEPLVKLNTVADNKFKTIYHLSEDLWWFLYKDKKTYSIDGITLKPILVNNDDFRYLINNKKELSLGYYTLEQLKGD